MDVGKLFRVVLSHKKNLEYTGTMILKKSQFCDIKLYAHVYMRTRSYAPGASNITEYSFLFANHFQCTTQISRLVEKPTMWFPTRSDTNQAVHSQKRARNLKFLI